MDTVLHVQGGEGVEDDGEQVVGQTQLASLPKHNEEAIGGSHPLALPNCSDPLHRVLGLLRCAQLPQG